MDVDSGYNYIEKFRGGVQWNMAETSEFISSISSILKIEKNQRASVNGQSITFRSSIKEM